MDGQHIWAVVVGIDHYEHDALNAMAGLKGARRDALAVYHHLTSDLLVPADHIRLLLSEPSPDQIHPEKATRQNIMSSLCDLRDNHDIVRNDNILFYFAGHGARYSLPRTPSGPRHPLDALCPADRGCESEGEVVRDIDECELSASLTELCAAKGSNIAVILDCCFALQGARMRGDSPGQNIRSIAPLEIPREQWTRVLHARSSSMAWRWDDRACVLLTACLEHELAQETKMDSEDEWHGCFTRALIAVLQLGGWTTYTDLVEKTTEYMPHLGPWCVQNPLAIGARQNELVWYRVMDSQTAHRIGSRRSKGAAGCYCVIF